MDQGFRLFPPSASTMSDRVDNLYFFLIGLTAFFTLLIFVLIVYFALKYRRHSGVVARDQTVRPDGNLVLWGCWPQPTTENGIAAVSLARLVQL